MKNNENGIRETDLFTFLTNPNSAPFSLGSPFPIIAILFAVVQGFSAINTFCTLSMKA
jgi:hypothetical protein